MCLDWKWNSFYQHRHFSWSFPAECLWWFYLLLYNLSKASHPLLWSECWIFEYPAEVCMFPLLFHLGRQVMQAASVCAPYSRTGIFLLICTWSFGCSGANYSTMEVWIVGNIFFIFMYGTNTVFIIYELGILVFRRWRVSFDKFGSHFKLEFSFYSEVFRYACWFGRSDNAWKVSVIGSSASTWQFLFSSSCLQLLCLSLNSFYAF